MLPATFGLAATQINILVDTVLASHMGDGPITYLAYAFRLMQLPIGLFGVAIATANLAHVSRDVARGDMEGLRTNLGTSLRAAALLTLPATAGLLALRQPIIRVIFEHGEFGYVATGKTAAALLCYALGLYAYSVTKIQVPTFYALGDTRTPVLASATAVGFKIAANFLLIYLIPKLGGDKFLGLALSTSLAAWINLFLLSRGLKKRVGSLASHRVVSTTLKFVALSLIMGLVCGVFHMLLESFLGDGGFSGELARLLAAVSLGVGIIGVGAHLMRVPEARTLVTYLRSFVDKREGD